MLSRAKRRSAPPPDRRTEHRRNSRIHSRQERIGFAERVLAIRSRLGLVSRLGPWMTALACLFGFGVAGVFVMRFAIESPYFRIKHVSVKGCKRAACGTWVRRSGVGPHRGLFSIDRERTEKKIEESPWIRKAEFQRIPPNRVVIKVSEWEPFATVRASPHPGGGLQRDYLVAADGTVFKAAEKDEGRGLPVITARFQTRLEDATAYRTRVVSHAVDFLARFRASYGELKPPRVLEVHVESERYVSLTLGPSPVVVHFAERDASSRFEQLRNILAELNTRSLRAEAIFLDDSRRENRVTVRATGM